MLIKACSDTAHYRRKPVVIFIVHYLYVLRPRGLFAFNFRSLCERCCEDLKY